MTNREKYDNAFIESLDVEKEQLMGLQYQGVPTWDSVGHMGLISETDDIVDFNSYEKGIELLTKYDVVVE